MKEIKRSTLLINKAIAIANIKSMAKKAELNNLSFEPHFKTHQSKEVAEWFRTEGISAITVSSVSMAAYFAANHWDKITIAFPVNVLELTEIDNLASRVELTLLVQEKGVISQLGQISNKVNLYIEIDGGYQRSGVDMEASKEISLLIEAIQKTKHHFKGFYYHAGNTYRFRNKAEVQLAYTQIEERLINLKSKFSEHSPRIAFGDTPSCSIVDKFKGIDSMHPGNFVFYDYTQVLIGSCNINQVATLMFCPVVATYKKRQEIVIFGGGVHLSKESITVNESNIYGIVGKVDKAHNFLPYKNSHVKSLSQEHGIISSSFEIISNIKVGDLVAILPVHSCMVVDCMSNIYTYAGEFISKLDK